MSSTSKTKKYKLSQFVPADIFKYLEDYNSDMAKIDEHSHIVATSDEPEVDTTGATLWYNTANKVLYHGMSGKWKPLTEVATSMSADDDMPMSVAVGKQIIEMIDRKSTVYKSNASQGIVPTPVNLILRVTKTQGGTGFSDNMQVSPNLGIRTGK